MTINTSIHPKRPVLDKFHTDDDAVTLTLMSKATFMPRMNL